MRGKPWTGVVAPSALRESLCVQCGSRFKSYPKDKRTYCSYECFVRSGGPFRAGLAASAATLKYGPKKDANHNPIMAALRKHCAVYDTSSAGCGIPDGIAWIKEEWHLFDIKNPKTGYGNRGLNKVQRKWLNQSSGGPIYLLYTEEEAERFAQGDFAGIKFEIKQAEAA